MLYGVEILPENYAALAASLPAVDRLSVVHGGGRAVLLTAHLRHAQAVSQLLRLVAGQDAAILQRPDAAFWDNNVAPWDYAGFDFERDNWAVGLNVALAIESAGDDPLTSLVFGAVTRVTRTRVTLRLVVPPADCLGAELIREIGEEVNVDVAAVFWWLLL